MLESSQRSFLVSLVQNIFQIERKSATPQWIFHKGMLMTRFLLCLVFTLLWTALEQKTFSLPIKINDEIILHLQTWLQSLHICKHLMLSTRTTCVLCREDFLNVTWFSLQHICLKTKKKSPQFWMARWNWQDYIWKKSSWNVLVFVFLLPHILDLYFYWSIFRWSKDRCGVTSTVGILYLVQVKYEDHVRK